MAARILIADGMTTNRITLCSVLKGARHETITVDHADGLVKTAEIRQPALILLDRDLPGGGLTALARLRAKPATRSIPVILTLTENLPSARLEGLRAGADDLVTRPFTPILLLARIRSLLRSRETAEALQARALTVREMGFAEDAPIFTHPGRAAFVAATLPEAERARRDLQDHTAHGVGALDVEQALTAAESNRTPDVLVIGAGRCGPTHVLRLLADLRSHASARHSAIIVIHDPEDTDTAAMALDLGASDLLETGFDPKELAHRIDVQLRRKREADSLRAAVEERLRLAVEDPLTGLFNRRYAMAHLQQILEQENAGERVCVLLVDIDRFKTVNDRFGHATGDAVLTEVAHRLRDNLRGMDMVARIGGEEFLIIMRDTNPEAALAAAERLCSVVRETAVTCPGRAMRVPVTVSIGMAMTAPKDTAEGAIDRADTALYNSKNAGRDMVTVSPPQFAA